MTKRAYFFNPHTGRTASCLRDWPSLMKFYQDKGFIEVEFHRYQMAKVNDEIRQLDWRIMELGNKRDMLIRKRANLREKRK